jgi:hypothetical protein
MNATLSSDATAWWLVQSPWVTNVSFSGKTAAIDPLQAPTDVQISYIVPSGVVSGPITVRSPKGSFTTTTNFFVPPQVTGFSPSTGRAPANGSS